MNAKRPRAVAAFTLVELLVVIVIIGMLVALISAAAAVALGRANETVVKIELDNLAQAFQAYKNKYGSYPPNFSDPAAFERHLKRAFPRNRELRATIDALSPLTPAEAIVFWLGGFSSNPEFPLTGPGGPLARAKSGATSNLDDRTFLFDFDKTRLVEQGTIDLGGTPIPLYVYHPAKLHEPYVYFDTSRGRFDQVGTSGYSPLRDWPLYTGTNGVVRAHLEKTNNSAVPFRYVNEKSFQVLSAGTDDDWGSTDWFLASDSPLTQQYGPIKVDGVDKFPPIYPEGPFLGGMADNLVNFSTKNLENSQP